MIDCCCILHSTICKGFQATTNHTCGMSLTNSNPPNIPSVPPCPLYWNSGISAMIFQGFSDIVKGSSS